MRPIDEHQYDKTEHRCTCCGSPMHVARGTTFHKCFYCGAEGYEVPTS